MRQNQDLRRPDNGRGCRHVPLAFAGSGLPRRKARARPGKPSSSASVTHLASSRSFGRNDLWVLAKVADFAHTRIFQLPQEAELPEVQVDES